MFDNLANLDQSTIQHIFTSNLANFGHLSFSASLGQSIIRSKFHVPAPHFPLFPISQLRQPILLFFLRKIFQLTWNWIEMIIWWRSGSSSSSEKRGDNSWKEEMGKKLANKSFFSLFAEKNRAGTGLNFLGFEPSYVASCEPKLHSGSW